MARVRDGREDGRERVYDERDRDDDPREGLMRDLDLPRDEERELVVHRDRVYELDGDGSRTLAAVGAFRVVPEHDLDIDHETLEHLRDEGLVGTVDLGYDERGLTLTRECRDLLDSHSMSSDREPSQAFYAGVSREREVEHDSNLYATYRQEETRLRDEDAGLEIRRVVLEQDLKRDYQEFLQEHNRGRPDSDGRPDRNEHEIRAWARDHDLPYFDRQVHFPDYRIEYEVDGREHHQDVELFTEHYRGAHGTVRGQNSREFMARLAARGFIRVIEPGRVRRGRLYHIHHKPLYEAIGHVDNRNRRLRIVGRMVERVMILDTILADRRCWWLSPADDKWRFCCLMRDNYLRPEDYPHIAFGSGRQRTARCFPDKLPIGVEKDRTDHLVFLYLVNRRIPVDFRQFLIRHLALLRFVRTWTVRPLVPHRFRKAVALYKAVLREELWTPMNPSVTKVLETYFPERRARGGHLGDPDDRYIPDEFRKQGMLKIQALYRAWRRHGDGVLWHAHLTTLRDDHSDGCSAIELELLKRQYLQLTGMMDRDVWAKRGAKRKSRQVGPPVSISSPDTLSPLVADEHEPQANA